MSAPPAEAALAVGAARRAIVQRLRAAGIESAELDGRVLLAHALGVEPEILLARSDRPLDATALDLVEGFVARRLAGEPVARIVGFKEFWSERFRLSPDVLVPRPETETVVEAALAACPERDAPLRILDLGCGSGALLGALLVERRRAFGVGIDRNYGALAVARANLNAMGVGARAVFACAHWCAVLGSRFHLIVCNPPYIRTGDLAALPPEVRRHDPVSALDGGPDGLDAYRAIVPRLPRLLAPGGVAVLELGAGQEDAVSALARQAAVKADGPAKRDLAGTPRALVLRQAESQKSR